MTTKSIAGTQRCRRCGKRTGQYELRWVEGHGPLCKTCRLAMRNIGKQPDRDDGRDTA